MVKKTLLAVLITQCGLGVVGSALASDRHIDWLHNYTSQNIRVDDHHSSFKDGSNFYYNANRSLWDSIPVQTSGDTWGSNEDDMPGFYVGHSGSGTKEIQSDVQIQGSTKDSHGKYRFYKIGRIAFDMVNGDHLCATMKSVHTHSSKGETITDDTNGLYLDQIVQMCGHHDNGHFAVHKTTIEARHFYVCVYSTSSVNVDYQVGLNKSGNFVSKLVDGTTTTLFTNTLPTHPGMFQTTSGTIHFGHDGSRLECTSDLGSFAVNGPSSRTQDNLIDVQVKNLSTGEAHSIAIGEPKIDLGTSDKDYGKTYIGLENGGITHWSISNSASISSQSKIACPGGFCFSGDPNGKNAVYLTYTVGG